jgi:hypothetical protein
MVETFPVKKAFTEDVLHLRMGIFSIETKAGTVPAGNGFQTYDDQGLFPSRPILSSEDPKEFVERG